MEPFLLKVARQILDESGFAASGDCCSAHGRHNSRLFRVLVVFNNHRSELFLREHFRRISQDEGLTFFLPRMMVVDDLVAQMGGMTVVPPEFLLFELYRIHTEMEGEGRKYKTFEEFIPFGELMLNDFSEVDRYMVDARDIFQNLHRMKETLEWDVEDPTMSEMQMNYLHFYQSLYEYYTRLRRRLEGRGQAYSGMAYRSVAERIGDLADTCPWDTIYFVGFNAISECEHAIISEFVRRGIGHLLTDGDAYYYDDEAQEAGAFLRKHSKEFAELGHYGPSLFATSNKNITIVECPENVLQCKYVGSLLAEHPQWLTEETEAGSTAIVLADESLLIPTLNALPDVGKERPLNVTMGFPYADSQLHTLVMKLLSLYRRHNAQGYYHADVVEVLSDRHIARLTHMAAPRQTVNRMLDRENLVRTDAAQLTAAGHWTKGCAEVVTTLLPDVQLTPDGCLEQIRHVVMMLVDEGTLTTNQRERQAAGAMSEVVDYLLRLQQEYHCVDNLDTLEKIYLRIAQRHTIAFLGKPLSGMQLLGMLETRNLDFRRVILLSAGEGVLPAARQSASLIPHELKRAFHLPTYEERDSVYAYNFYRLLQRAEEVYLVYSSDPGNAGKGEESRLLRQVRCELARRFPQTVKVSDTVVDTGGRHVSRDVVAGSKSDAVMQRLWSIGEGYGFSPTSLERYVECPLKYYYTNVLGLRNEEGVEDDIDASDLGEVVHNVMKSVYEPFVGRRVDAASLRRAQADIESLLDSEMERLMSGGRSREGRNMLLRSVALTQLRRALGREADIADRHTLEIVAVEQDYRHTMWHHDGHAVTIGGRVDRIDRLNGTLRIIDYKTGSLADSEITYTASKAKMPGKWLQLMCYALMYRRRFPTAESLRVGIYPLRYPRSGVRLARWDNEEALTDAMLDDFEQRLTELMKELFNRDIPFAATPSTTTCKWCPAAAFCAWCR